MPQTTSAPRKHPTLLTHSSQVASCTLLIPPVPDPPIYTHTHKLPTRILSLLPITSLAHLPQTPCPRTPGLLHPRPCSHTTLCTPTSSPGTSCFIRMLLGTPPIPPTHHTLVHTQSQRIFSSPQDHPGDHQATRPHSKPGLSRFSRHGFAFPTPMRGPEGGAVPPTRAPHSPPTA